MFSDPITITINGVAKTLARTKVGDENAVYKSADQLLTLEVNHQTTPKGRVRTTVRFTQSKTVTNPLDSTNDYDSVTETRTFDRPGFGFSDVEWYQLATGLSGWFTQANVTKLFGHES